MAARYRRMSVEVDIDINLMEIFEQIDTEDLIAEIAHRTLTAAQVKALAKVVPVTADDDELYEAAGNYARGQIHECLIHIERALPRDFRGLADRVQ